MAQPVLQKLAVCPRKNRAAAIAEKLFYSRFSVGIKAALCTLPLILSLAGCQSYFQRIDDCKTGDWDAMGRSDGRSGEPSNYDDRREFCSFHTGIAVTDSAARYSAGWTKGNWDLWYAMGEGEGRHGSQSQYEKHASDAEVRDKKTPLNQPAYDAGWLAGNIQYWYDTGRGEGNSGRPLSRKEANRELAAAMPLRFDEASYVEGWHAGNRSFWFDAGFYDAHYGIPDSEFQKRAAAARTDGVDVQEAAYREAWNGEIVVYWRDLGTKDATSGKEFGERSLEAKKKGLKIFEQEYRQAWVARLTDYWRQAGKDDGYGQPFKLESRIASARHDGVFVIPATRDLYTAAWQEQNTLYCQPENAFQGGVANQNFAIDVCRAELRNQLRHAYVSGQDYKATEARYLDASYDADHLRSQLSDARYDLDRVEREIRNNREAKDRPVTDETIRQGRYLEQKRREISDRVQGLQSDMIDASMRADHYQEQMQRLHREIY